MSEKKIKVLHVINGMGSGGAEMLIMNWLRNIDTNKFQFDFLLRTHNCMYTEEIKQSGGQIYYTDPYPSKAVENFKQTKLFFDMHHYDVVHVHGNALMYMEALKQAKKHNIKCIIMHSHNTKTNRPEYLFIHRLNELRLPLYANVFLACGEDAGHWMFGKKPFTVIVNGVDQKRFHYDPLKREKAREELGLTNEFVVGHVGHFMPVKNHQFIIDVFNEVQKIRPNSKLLLIGDGPEEQNIRDKIKALGIEEKVIFLGVRRDVDYIEQAMDSFIFPSIHEGLPFSLIEAQCCGLPCISSNTVSLESKISKNIQFLSLNDGAKNWAETIIKIDDEYPRSNNYLTERAKEYSAARSARIISKIYEEHCK